MTRLHIRRHPEQRSLLAACTTSAPAAAPAGPRARAVDVLFDLRAEDAMHAELAAARATLLLPLHRPADPTPTLIREAEHGRAVRDHRERGRFDEDRRRRETAQAAEWVSDAVATMLAENVAHVRAALAARPEFLTPPAHPGPRLLLRRIALLLDEPKPLTFDYQGLLDHAGTLTHRNLDRAAEQLKGLVA